MASNTLTIRVRADGVRVVSRGLQGMGAKAKAVGTEVYRLKRALQTLFAAAGIRAVFRAVEQFTELNNKIKTVTSSTRELTRVRKLLLGVANETRSSMASVVQLYARTTRAVKTLGLSEKTRLKFAKLLTKEAVIGGATTIEADNAIRQLTQGMGAAGLKGEELRSVLEQLPTVAQRIAEFLGVSQGELRKLGEEGELTGQVVVEAMLAAEQSIEKAFGETTSTVGQAFEVFKNNFVEFAGEIDGTVGSSKALAATLQVVGKNLKIISALLLVMTARAAFVFMANNGLTLATVVAKATAKVVALARALFVVSAAAPAVKATSEALRAAYVAKAGLGAVAAPTIGVLSATAMFGIVAAAAALTLGFVYLISRQNKYVSEVERATEAEKAHEEAILSKMAAMGINFSGRDDLTEFTERMNKQNTDPFIRLQEDLPGISEKLNNVRRAILSIASAKAELLFAKVIRDGIPANKLISLERAEREIERASKKLSILKSQLVDIKEGLAGVNIEATKDISVATVLADAEIAAKGLGGEFAFLQKAAEGFVSLFDRGTLIELTEEEIKGTTDQQKASKVEAVVGRIKELGDAYDENTASTKNYNQALAVNEERLDDLRGGAAQAAKTLLAENALFNKFAGDLQIIGMKLAGATEEELAKVVSAKLARKALTDARDADVASQRAAESATRQNKNALDATLKSMREQIRLFGLTGRARAKAEFKSLGPNAGQLKEFTDLQNKAEQKGIAAGIQEKIAKLKATTFAFSEQARLLEETAKTAGPKQLEKIDRILVEGKDAIARQAKSTAEAIAADLGTAGDKSIEEIRVALVAGAGVIGTQAGTALVTAFKAAALAALPGLSSLLPPGVPGGETSTEQQNTERESRNVAIDAAALAAGKATQAARELNEEFRLFGPTVETATSRGSAALQGFGEEAITFGGELKNAFSSIFGSLEDALVGFVTTGKLDFKSLINSILADLARMVVRMLIIKPLMGFFGGFFGGIFGFSGGGSVGGAFGLPGFDDGGLVNNNPKTPQKFATGGQVHGFGTGVSDSVPAVLSRKEFVVKAASAGPNMAGLNYLNKTGRMPGGGNITSVSFSPNISVSVNGDSKSAAQDGSRIGKEIRAEMRAEFNEFVREEQKPGGALAKTNKDVL